MQLIIKLKRILYLQRKHSLVNDFLNYNMRYFRMELCIIEKIFMKLKKILFVSRYILIRFWLTSETGIDTVVILASFCQTAVRIWNEN